jgi:UDPglucose--hexose-1-phosphate uridylyltransferase
MRSRPRPLGWSPVRTERPARHEGRRPDDAAVLALESEPHRRYNALTDEWVLVSAGRTRRPWLGAEEPEPPEHRPSYDPECYLCPGNLRVNGAQNPGYDTTFVFTNDFAALRPDTSDARVDAGLFRAEGTRGTCRVVCFSPRHDLTLAGMSDSEIRCIVDVWADETSALGRQYRWVQVFENRGEAMGASNPHPHGQIWAGDALPVEAAHEDNAQARHLAEHGGPLLVDYAHAERGGPRVIAEARGWLTIAPFWAAWPFETLLVPTEPAPRLADLSGAQRDGLATALRDLTRRYDALFARPFPYSMGWHQAPFGKAGTDHWQVHAHFYPPLLRATVRKFMVGYELLAEPQRDLTPEEAAERLRVVVPTPPDP